MSRDDKADFRRRNPASFAPRFPVILNLFQDPPIHPHRLHLWRGGC